MSRLRSCPTLEQIESRFAGNGAAGIDGNDLSDAELDEHLRHCESCRKTAEQIRSNNDILRDFADAARQRPRHESTTPNPAMAPGFEIISEIRRGGQGVVYRARQKATKREVALKMMLAGRWASDRQRRRFEREIELVASLRHPRIVTLYESGPTSDGGHYFAMEYIDGQPLDVYLESAATSSRSKVGADTLSEAGLAGRLALFCRICDAVQHAHRLGVIHRDLKPGNILVDAHGEPHVLDFGVARALGDDYLGQNRTATKTGEFMGTFAYAAPEQVSGNPDQVDTRTDVYSLGVILYEMVGGGPPYSGDSSLSDLLRHITQIDPPPPSQHRREVNNELDTIVLKALAKEKDRRYASVESLRRDIERFLAGEPIDAKRNSTWYVLRKMARRYRILVGSTAGVILLLGAFAVSMTLLANQVRQERDRANENADRLTQSINSLRIESGRTTGAAGDFGLAEETLWHAHLNPPTGGISESPMELVGDGGPSASFWSLWELYSRAPGLATWAATPADYGLCSVLFNVDASLIAMACHDGQIRVWDTKTASVRYTVGRAGTCLNMGLSPDGKLLAVVQHDGSVDMWRLDPLGLIGKAVSEETVRSVSFSDDSRRLATCGAKGLIQVWDVERFHVKDRPEPIHSLRVAADNVLYSAFTPSRETIAVLHGSEVDLWNLATGEIDPMFIGPSPGRQIVYSPDGRTIAAAFTSTVCLIDVETRASWSYVHGGRISMLRFSPDGLFLVSTSGDNFVKLADTTSRRVEQIHTSTRRAGCYAAFADNGRTIIVVQNDGVVRLWEPRPQRHLYRIDDFKRSILFIEYSPDGRWLAAGGGDVLADARQWAIDLRDGASGRLVRRLYGHTSTVSALAFSQDGRLLVSGSYDGTIRTWDTETGECLSTLTGHKELVCSLALSAKSALLASGGSDNVRLWDLNTGECVHVFTEHTRRVPQVAFSADGRLLASCGIDARVVVRDVSRRETLWSLQPNMATMRTVCFNPDGKSLASAGDDRMIRLWNAADGKALAAWEAHGYDIFTLAFHRDGRLLASAGRGPDIKLWDASTGKHVFSFEGHDAEVYALAFHPDGRTLASGGADEMLALWDLTYYHGHIARNLEFQVRRLSPKDNQTETIHRLRAWADGVLKQPWPRYPWGSESVPPPTE